MENDIQKRIDKAIQDKNKRIQEYRSETQLSIQLGQSVNLALQYLGENVNKLGSAEFERQLNAMTDFFMSYLDKKRKEVFDENERAYKENPAPTVVQYEAMNPVQKAFLKDKQLERNRANYQARKNVSPEQNLAERVTQKQKGLQVNFRELNK